MTEPTKDEIRAGAWSASENQRGDPECVHEWELGITLDMAPPIYNRSCRLCRRWETSQAWIGTAPSPDLEGTE